MPAMKIRSILNSSTSRGEPLRNSTWELVIGQLGGDEFSLACQGVNFPAASIEKEEIHHFNEKTSIVQGPPSYDDIEITALDTVDNKQAQVIQNWWKLVWDEKTGQLGFTSDYMKPGTLMQYNVKGELVRQWELIDLWPTSFNMGAGSYDDHAATKITLTLSVNRAIMKA